ncbi:MAG: response regulator transcription factor [Bacteroidia bacterium]|nr:response regulator transcription factor [Bacteroidia bacterium]
MSFPIRVAITDDETLFRKGIRGLVEGFEGVEVSIEAIHGQDLLDQLTQASHLPDVALLDLNMPEMNGVETAKALQERFPDIRVIILSSYFSKAFIINMIELGASGYLPKNSLPVDVERTIREVAEKGFSYGDQVMEVIRENMVKKMVAKPTFALQLTERETEILQLICEQYTAAEIAEKLFISPRTVDGHRNNLLQKLHCRNTAGLVVYALQNNLVNVRGDLFG